MGTGRMWVQVGCWYRKEMGTYKSWVQVKKLGTGKSWVQIRIGFGTCQDQASLQVRYGSRKLLVRWYKNKSVECQVND